MEEDLPTRFCSIVYVVHVLDTGQDDSRVGRRERRPHPRRHAEEEECRFVRTAIVLVSSEHLPAAANI